MMRTILPDYFSIYAAQLPVIGQHGQEQLQRATVAVKGIGRLGSNIVTNLVSAGVSHIIVQDPQDITADSLNGWVLSGTSEIGTPKPFALQELLHHRPHLAIEPLLTDSEFADAVGRASVIVSA